MNIAPQYSRVNRIPAMAAADSARPDYSRVNSEPPWPRPPGAPSIHKAPDRRGFVVYGASETVMKRRFAVMLLPK